jgi:hypothetical protein
VLPPIMPLSVLSSNSSAIRESPSNFSMSIDQSIHAIVQQVSMAPVS